MVLIPSFGTMLSSKIRSLRLNNVRNLHKNIPEMDLDNTLEGNRFASYNFFPVNEPLLWVQEMASVFVR